MKAFVLVNVHAGKSPGVVTALRRIDAVKLAHACWGPMGHYRSCRGAEREGFRKPFSQAIAGIESSARKAKQIQQW